MQRARRKTPYDRLAASTLRTWLYVSSKLSLRAVQRLGRLVGDLAYFADGSLRRITQTNVSACYPQLSSEEIRRLTRESLRQTACYATELGHAWRDDGRRWKSLIVDVVGEIVIDAAVADRKAVLILAPHFGNWEIVNLYLGERLPLLVLYEPLRIASLDPIAAAGRARTGSHLAPLDKGGLRRLIDTLQHGEAVALLPDQVPALQSGEYAPFFGREALTMTLAHRLVEQFRPSVVLAYARRLPDGQGFQLGFERLQHIEDARTSSESLAMMNVAIERVIALDPSQYQWEYKRFRRPRRADEELY
jgi:Kdo2-lipid IVA lauroyltransferase/acyltransferase